MHKTEYVLDIETHKTLWNFEIPTDNPIPTGRPDLLLIDKKKKKIS